MMDYHARFALFVLATLLMATGAQPRQPHSRPQVAREVEIYSDSGDLYVVGERDIHLQPAPGRRVLVDGADIASKAQSLTEAVDHLRAQFQGAYGISGCSDGSHYALDCSDAASRATARLLNLCSFDRIINCCCPEVERAHVIQSDSIHFAPDATALRMPNLESSTSLSLIGTPLEFMSIGFPQSSYGADVFILNNPHLEYAAVAGRRARRVIVSGNPVLGALDLSGFSARGSSVFIVNNPISDLNLDGLTSVRRIVIENTTLTSVEFGRLRTLQLHGDIYLTDNAFLETVRLLNVSDRGGLVRINYRQRHVLNFTDVARVNAALEFSQGLNVTHFAIADLPLHLGVPVGIHEFADMKTITSEGLTRLEVKLSLSGNEQLTAMDLTSLTQILAPIRLFSNTQLRAVHFNSRVTHLPHQLYVYHSPSLSSLDLSMLRNASELQLGLNGLTAVNLSNLQEVQGTLALNNNPIAALNISSLQRVGASLYLHNIALSTLQLPHNLSSIGGNLFCSGPSLNYLHLGRSLTHVGFGVSLIDGALEALELGALTHVGGTLNAKQNKLSSLDLSGLQFVGVDINLEQNALTSVTFAPGLNLSNTLALGENKFDSLTLAGIVGVGGDLRLGENPDLRFLGFGSLQRVGGNIEANPMLSTVDFGNLTQVGGDVNLAGNSLLSISLGNLQRIGGDLILRDNRLSSVDLSNVTSIAGRIVVEGNSPLTFLDCNNAGRCVCAAAYVELLRCKSRCPAQEC